jgi:hypothetical protein
VFPRADRSIAVEWVGYQVITLHPIEGLEKRANSVGTCRELAQAGPPLPPPHWWPENGPPPPPPEFKKFHPRRRRDTSWGMSGRRPL